MENDEIRDIEKIFTETWDFVDPRSVGHFTEILIGEFIIEFPPSPVFCQAVRDALGIEDEMPSPRVMIPALRDPVTRVRILGRLRARLSDHGVAKIPDNKVIRVLADRLERSGGLALRRRQIAESSPEFRQAIRDVLGVDDENGPQVVFAVLRDGIPARIRKRHAEIVEAKEDKRP
jgi:hypothetical protein